MTSQAGTERVGQAFAEDHRSNVGVKDDNAHARPVCRAAWMNEMNSSSSSSDSKRSVQASSSTDSTGRMPCPRSNSSAGTRRLYSGGLVVRATAGHDATLLSLPLVPINVSSTSNTGHDQRVAAAWTSSDTPQNGSALDAPTEVPRVLPVPPVGGYRALVSPTPGRCSASRAAINMPTRTPGSA